MAISSYPIDGARLGFVVSQGDATAYVDQTGQQRHDTTGTGMPMWSVPALLADQDLELRVRFAATSRPEWPHNTPLRLDGATRVSAYAARVAGSQRASLTIRTERCDVSDQFSDDLFAAEASGLYLVDTGDLTVVAASHLEPRFPKTGDWTRFAAARGWASGDESLSGMEKWSIDVPGRSFPGVRRLQVVAFDGLRVSAYVNADRTTVRLDLEASAVRPVATPATSNGRQRREVVVPAAEENGAEGGS